jgi:8-oxo-dGTP pyrophosphatase MutT (NUDIX family)|tara:strand:- start:20593 stop:21243 length:651 start_codon:yes stop_codon:yes gene_type:complete
MSSSYKIQPWFEFLSEWIPAKLPGERVHAELSPLRKLSSEALKEAKVIKQSAVAIHVFEKDDDLQIILTQRNTYDGAHSGQVSFPGGKMDDTDLNLIHTARRESYEEIGLSIDDGELIGELTEIYIPVSQFRVKPYLFFHRKALTNLRPDPREVESIFFLPRNILINDDILIKKDIIISSDFTLKQVPCFQYHEFTIWGATAIMLNELKHILKENS